MTTDASVMAGVRLLDTAGEPGAGLRYAVAEPEAGLEAIAAADVRGRGGANFPAALKWRAALRERGPRVVIGNGGEHEPGSQKDAVLLRRHPELVIEGLLAAGTILGAGKTILLLDGRLAPLAERLREIVDGFGPADLGLPTPEIVIGPEEYLVGEETALIEVLERKPAKPRFRPPLPVVKGYLGYPTVVQNIETLANCAWVLRRIAEDPGAAPAVDTFLWTVWGPGRESVVGESPVGTTIGAVLQAAGVAQWKGVTLGGFSGGAVRAAEAELALDPVRLAEHGLSLGCGSFRVIDAGACVGALAQEVMEFFAAGSCGQCVPCQAGLADAARVLAGKKGRRVTDLADMLEMFSELEGRGVCRLPDGGIATTRALLDRFGDEIQAHAERRCGCGREAS
ncbi:MAG TPA: NADH-ubiquinone oxidoreductase-F iron-sulfur binding region domain-containing protein [Acidimicrobiia bacterium]|nr:NADH-ubiquinone oxidoreductase-F iron-sulfur binding region domain-containing protein [Acidimicrobiia bacterium]